MNFNRFALITVILSVCFGLCQCDPTPPTLPAAYYATGNCSTGGNGFVEMYDYDQLKFEWIWEREGEYIFLNESSHGGDEYTWNYGSQKCDCNGVGSEALPRQDRLSTATYKGNTTIRGIPVTQWYTDSLVQVDVKGTLSVGQDESGNTIIVQFAEDCWECNTYDYLEFKVAPVDPDKWYIPGLCMFAYCP